MKWRNSLLSILFSFRYMTSRVVGEKLSYSFGKKHFNNNNQNSESKSPLKTFNCDNNNMNQSIFCNQSEFWPNNLKNTNFNRNKNSPFLHSLYDYVDPLQ